MMGHSITWHTRGQWRAIHSHPEYSAKTEQNLNDMSVKEWDPDEHPGFNTTMISILDVHLI